MLSAAQCCPSAWDENLMTCLSSYVKLPERAAARLSCACHTSAAVCFVIVWAGCVNAPPPMLSAKLSSHNLQLLTLILTLM